MSKLSDLLESVKDEKLPLTLLEQYRDQLIHLHTAVCLERAELRKKEAFYFIDHKAESDIATKRAWRVTVEGQRLLELEAYKTVLPKEIDSLKSRIYAMISPIR